MSDPNSIRRSSKGDYTCFSGRPSTEELKTGALMRIADASEKMAQRYTDLIDECQRYKGDYEDLQKLNAAKARRIIALKGVITKLRNARTK